MAREGDYIQQLADYIKKNLKKGYTLESLKWALINQDYSRSAITRAINLANEQLAKKAPKIKEKPVIKYEVITDNEVKKEIKTKETFWSKLKKFFS